MGEADTCVVTDLVAEARPKTSRSSESGSFQREAWSRPALKKPNHARQQWANQAAYRKQLRRRRRHVAARRRDRQLLKSAPRDKLVAPDRFMLWSTRRRRDEGSRVFLMFLERLRSFRGRALTIDLSRVRSMHVAATLLFKAELCYLRKRGVQLRAVPPTRSRTQQVLQQTGLCTLLRLNINTAVNRADVVHWRHASGRHDYLDPDLVGGLLQDVENPIDSPLYTGTLESVANCVEHAYQEHRARRPMVSEEDGWWAFQQVRDGNITVCVCDLGIGVANALPIRLDTEPTLLKRLLRLFKKVKSKDCRAIRAALEYGRSGTGQPNRGKGLRDATRVIDAAGDGFFALLSNAGLYSYTRTGPDRAPIERTARLDKSICGTIYMWNYPLQSAEQATALMQEQP